MHDKELHNLYISPNIIAGDQIKEYHGRDRNFLQNTCQTECGNLEELGVDGNIILKLALNKWHTLNASGPVDITNM
jgi:hypothetical protein